MLFGHIIAPPPPTPGGGGGQTEKYTSLEAHWLPYKTNIIYNYILQ